MSQADGALRLKICGIARTQDALLASELGAWALGFVFHAPSPRSVNPERAAAILREVGIARGAARPRAIGVFVNASLEEVVKTAEAAGLDGVQLHGDESVEHCESLVRMLPRVRLIRALRPKSLEELASIPRYLETCESVLIDAAVAGAYGGTGVKADWGLARQAAGLGPVILAGGLNPGNIREAILQVRPFALDASSGLESSPGVKDEQALRDYFANAREVR